MNFALKQLVEQTLCNLDSKHVMNIGINYMSILTSGIDSTIIYVYSSNKKKFFTSLDYLDGFYIPLGVGTVSMCFISRETIKKDNSIFFPMPHDLGVVQFNLTRKLYKNEKNIMRDAVNIFSAILKNSLDYNAVRETFDSFVDVLSAAIDARDYVTSGHSKRTTLYAQEMCSLLNMDKLECKTLEYAALLHDIGKITVSENILSKSSKLTNSEFDKIKKHTTIGAQLMSRAKFPVEFRKIPKIIESHHERWDGNGYPSGLRGEEIPLEARIISICDVFDALTSARQYRAAIPISDAKDLMVNEMSGYFDKYLLDVFFQIPLSKLIEIFQSYRI